MYFSVYCIKMQDMRAPESKAKAFLLPPGGMAAVKE